jgi:Asp-tRNA(Asn)/Glu-tRNA(Gln) amidotransferase A subunit family amidase
MMSVSRLLRNSAYYKTDLGIDDPQLQQGTPVAVQLVGRRFQEEKMIALLEMFEEALKF